MIILRHGRYISDSRIFRVGEILPDTPGVQGLVERKLAEVVAEVPASCDATKTPKAPKKRDTETAPKNDEGDS